MTATYLGNIALEQLDRAQAEVDRHVAAGLDGRCLSCREVQPCTALERANATFRKYNRMPVRRAGLASRGVARGDSFGWFQGSLPANSSEPEEPTS